MSQAKTKEQERAGVAWGNVASVKGQSCEGRYAAWVKKFPALVLVNGLGQALAFLRAKNKDHHRALYQHVSEWVTGQVYGSGNSDGKLLERLLGGVPNCESDSTVYRRATTETLAFIIWLKRFAEAELKAEEGDD